MKVPWGRVLDCGAGPVLRTNWRAPAEDVRDAEMNDEVYPNLRVFPS